MNCTAEGVKVNGDSQKPRSPYCGESTNKENSYANKIQEKKFSLQPQQMKKKKKGGGYNLRKSLAWDRAFSEEQGYIFLTLNLANIFNRKPN